MKGQYIVFFGLPGLAMHGIVCLLNFLGPSKSIQSLLTHLVHNSFHLHNIPDDKCSCILPWYYCSKHLHRSCEYFLRIRLCL